VCDGLCENITNRDSVKLSESTLGLQSRELNNFRRQICEARRFITLVDELYEARVVLLVAEATYTVTDPPLRFLRRFIKPIRIGAVAIDLSWTLLLFAVYIAMSWVV
jgi:hypothetical protein